MRRQSSSQNTVVAPSAGLVGKLHPVRVPLAHEMFLLPVHHLPVHKRATQRWDQNDRRTIIQCTAPGDGGSHTVLWKPPDSQNSCSSPTVQFAAVPGPTAAACSLTQSKHAVALDGSLWQHHRQARKHGMSRGSIDKRASTTQQLTRWSTARGSSSCCPSHDAGPAR